MSLLPLPLDQGWEELYYDCRVIVNRKLYYKSIVVNYDCKTFRYKIVRTPVANLIKHIMIVKYDVRVVLTRVVIYDRKMFIRLAATV